MYNNSKTPLRVATWPATAVTGDNPYIRLFQNALAACNIQFVSIPGTLRDLASPNFRIDAVNIHWGVESNWRYPGRSPLNAFENIRKFRAVLSDLKSADIKIIWTVHNLIPHERMFRLDWLWDWLGYRWLSRHADLCILHSEWAKQRFLRLYQACPDRVIVMPHGNYDGCYSALSSRERIRSELGIPADRRVVVSCGQIRKYKGLITAVQAFSQLGTPYHLVVAGSPHDDTLARHLVKSASAVTNVTILPQRLTDQDLVDLHAAADAVCLPYLRITGSGALNLAATFGRGMIASDLPYFREAISTEPDMGMLFRAGDVKGMLKAVDSYFCIDPEIRHRAARRWSDRHAWPSVVTPVGQWINQNIVATRSRCVEGEKW